MLSSIKKVVPWRVRDRLSRWRFAAENRALSLVTRPVPLPVSVAHREVLFLGASVGRDWRLHLVFPTIETLTAYQFDKGELVERAVQRAPDAVIIKECAAYFPPKRPHAEQIPAWVERLRGAGIRPALATVVPVTREHARLVPGRAEGLWEVNDWLRDFARAEGVPLLDLEEALRISADERYLRDGLDSGDGLHLRRATYRERLDGLVPPLLLRTFEQR